ncbi:hypothetical protein [Polycyclovorans algicola]|uniref:hypothetical protein n=1 Tax=Polycyclovorans algicola TaxID=616992 RepID=UPI0012686C44|nr:hypothetical protein [Polycyclovorans algicola]
MKDQAIAAAIKAYATDKLSPYGNLLDVTVDTASQQVEATINLHGEGGPVTVKVEHYRLEKIDGRMVLKLETITATREWMGTLLTHLYGSKPFKLPAPILALL